jgi:membrane fusion protein, heavy metal efflux system
MSHTVTSHSGPSGFRATHFSLGTADFSLLPRMAASTSWLVCMKTERRTITLGAAVIATVASFFAGAYVASRYRVPPPDTFAVGDAVAAPETAGPKAEAVRGPKANTVELLETQLKAVKVEVAAEHEFPLEKQAVGSIDFNEEMLTPIFTPYQGRIVGLFAKVGDEVQKGQTLFTIDSPDLLAADSSLISTAGVLQLTTRSLARLRSLYESRAVSQKDLEQAISDQQTAEGALRAARDAVRIFGKTDSEIDKIVSERMADPTLVVPSPISGRVTARNAAPGLLVQPGNAPAPFTVADVSTMWMLANVAESDSPSFRVGQDVRVTVMAYPGREFGGRISTIGSTVDPTTHRVLVRSEIDDPNHELRSGMFANFIIRTGEPMRSVAVPYDGVVREGDGTMTVWVTADRRRFTQRSVKVGLLRDGYYQILEGLQPGELVATEGALFLSNALAIAAR